MPCELGGNEVPSSNDRRRVELPTHLYDEVSRIARTEGRTVSGVLSQMVWRGLRDYHSEWIPEQHMQSLSRRARRVLEFAAQEAHSFNHNYIGTEHLLLALLREHQGVAAQVLTKLGVTAQDVREGIVAIVGREGQPAEGDIEFVPRVRKVLGLAIDEAARLDHGFVRTEHMLLAIVHDGGGVGAEILEEKGVLGRIRAETLATMGRQSYGSADEVHNSS